MSESAKVLVLALNDLTMDRRVEAEARSLAAAGFAVTRVGLRVRADQPTIETTPFDTIVRMAPAWYRPLPPRTQDSKSTQPSSAPLARQWGPKVALMGAVRRLLPKTMRSLDRYRTWKRFNAEYVATCRGLRPDAVIACDLDTLEAGVRLKQEFGCVLVYDAHEWWTEQHSHRGLSRTFKRLMNRREGRLAAQADLVTTVSTRFADSMERRYGIPRPQVVYTGTFWRNERPSETSRPLRAYFQGSFSPDRGLEDIVRAVALTEQDVSLTLQGYGRLAEDLRELAASLGLDERSFVLADACAPSEVANCAALYDVGIVAGTPESLNARLTTPNRLFTYIAGGIALLTSAALEEVAEIVSRYECGVVVPDATPQAMAAALDRLAADPDAVGRMKENALRAAADLEWERQFSPVIERLRASLGTDR